MTVTTVFSTAVSFLSFASARETNSVPKLEDVAWGSSVATISLRTTDGSQHSGVSYIDIEREYKFDTIVANYLLLGFDDDNFQSAYVAFPCRSNFDKVTNGFLERYGRPHKPGSAFDNHYWIGNGLNVRLHYQVSTDEGILAITYQRILVDAQVKVERHHQPAG